MKFFAVFLILCSLHVCVCTEVYSQRKPHHNINPPNTANVGLSRSPFHKQHPPEIIGGCGIGNALAFEAGSLAKKDGTLPFYLKYGGLLVSAGLMSYGIVALNVPLLHKWDEGVAQYIGVHVSRKYHIDDYIQYGPVAAVYGLSLAGVPAKNNFRDRLIVGASSYLITAGVVNILKYAAGVQRPDSDARNSFPSGHTATAFTGAHILFKEYKDISPWIGVGGYVVAAATGALRMINDRHWLSDVIMGAGIGIAAAELGYILLPLVQGMFGITPQDTGFSLQPVSAYGYSGLGLSYVF